MPLIKTNLQDVSTEGPEPMETAIVENLISLSAEYNAAVGDKSPAITVLFRDNDAPVDDLRTAHRRFSLSPKAMFHLKRWLIACGSPLADAEELNLDDLKGLVCKAAVEKSSYTDKITGELRWSAEPAKFINPS